MIIEQGFTEAGGIVQAGWSTIAVGSGGGIKNYGRRGFTVNGVSYGGAYSYRCSTSTVVSQHRSALSSVGTKETYYKFAYYRNNATSWPRLRIRDSAGATLVEIVSSFAAQWQVLSGGTRINTGVIPTQGVWSLIELRHVNTNPGSLRLKIDGVSYNYIGALAVGNGNGARQIDILGARDFYIDDLEVAAITMRYDGGTGAVPVAGEVVTGAGGGSATVTSVISGDGVSGVILLHGWNEVDFADNEVLTGSTAMIAAVDAPTEDFVSGFEPFSLWFGDAYCIRANANANGTYSELTNSAGNHTDNYTYIDDQAGGSDYVEATAADEKDTYGFNMDALPPDTDVSYGVFTVSTYAKSSLAGVDGWNPYIRYAGVDYPGAREALTTGYIGYNQAFATVVGGSTRWTQASLAAAEIGVQFVA